LDPKVKVYRYEVYDRVWRCWRLEPHYATAAFIEAAGGLAYRESAIEVTDAALDDAGRYHAALSPAS
jgi:hypothetical protein